MADFDAIADELYGLQPDEFTAARTRYEKAAKAAGDRDLAVRIHSLGKPTVTAWLANQLVRAHRDELEPLLELGAGLREATRTLAGEQLRALSRQQSELVRALVQHARQLARTAGRALTEDTVRGLEETLRAALADEDVANVLLAGHLTDALHTSGFDTGFGGSSNVIPLRPRQSASISKDQSGGRRQRADEQRRQAEQDLAEAQRALADAGAFLDQAQTDAADAEQKATAAQQRLEELREQLEEANTTASDADRRRRDASKALQRAELAVRNAERRRTDAQDRRDRLAGQD